jgi:hypothetical protein
MLRNSSGMKISTANRNDILVLDSLLHEGLGSSKVRYEVRVRVRVRDRISGFGGSVRGLELGLGGRC